MPNKSISPNETIAYDATMQVAILSGNISKQTSEILLLGDALLSLGIGAAGGEMALLIKWNTTIPTKK